jgi:hypothetical protein
MKCYLCGRHGPHFEVVRPHEQVRDARPHHAQDPLVKILGFGICDSIFERGVDHAVHAFDLFFFGEHGDVVLEGVRDPEVLAADVGDALVLVPVFFGGEGFVDAVVKILVVGKYDVTAHIV